MDPAAAGEALGQATPAAARRIECRVIVHRISCFASLSPCVVRERATVNR